METEDPGQEYNEQSINSKEQFQNGDGKKFNIQLSVAQANALATMLPRGMSFQAEKQAKSRKITQKKKPSTLKKEPSNLQLDIEEPSERLSKIKSAQRYAQDMSQLNNYSRAASQGYYEQIQDFMKPCLRILHMLKNHRTSWPFKDPVDPVSLNIPNYFEIIKDPMDLQTVQKKLKTRVYVTPSQFHADIGKIIRNSYEFNKNNPDFCKLTSQFEQYYLKISSDSSSNRAMASQNSSLPSSQMDQKKKKSKISSKSQQPRFREASDNQPATLAEKKALTLQIKKLPKQYLKQVIDIVYQGKTPTTEQLNIESLPVSKIRQLQRFVWEKNSYLQTHSRLQKQQENDAQEGRDVESSFESDSDS